MQNLDLSALNIGKEQLATLKNVQSVLAKLDGSRRRSCKEIGAVSVSPLLGKLSHSHSRESREEKNRKGSADLAKKHCSASSFEEMARAKVKKARSQQNCDEMGGMSPANRNRAVGNTIVNKLSQKRLGKDNSKSGTNEKKVKMISAAKIIKQNESSDNIRNIDQIIKEKQ